MEPYKYLHNLLAMPIVLVLFLAGVLAVLGGIAVGLLRDGGNGIWFTGPGTVFGGLLALYAGRHEQHCFLSFILRSAEFSDHRKCIL